MICNYMSELPGLTCHPLTDDGLIAMIDSPLKYPDGDDLPIFVEKLGPQIRFFDDGGSLLHLFSRGLSLGDHRETEFIKNIVEPNHVKLNDLGELEIWCAEKDASTAFTNFLSAMRALVKWETDQVEVSAFKGAQALNPL